MPSTEKGLWVYFPRFNGDTFFVPLQELETFICEFPGRMPDGYADLLREQVPTVEPPNKAVLKVVDHRHSLHAVPHGYPFKDL